MKNQENKSTTLHNPQNNAAPSSTKTRESRDLCEWDVHVPFWALLIVTLLVSYALFGINLQADFGLLDDHQIMHYLEEDGQLALTELPAKLMETEVGRPGESLRYRPFYFSFRLLETVLWGKQVVFWYAFRLFLFAVVIAIGWAILQALLGIVPATALIAIYITAFPKMWPDVFARLGPSEVYAAVGTMLFCVGVLWILRPDKKPHRATENHAWFLLFVGAIIASGSKENFLLLFIPYTFLVLYALSKNHKRPVLIAIWGILFFYIAFITGAIATAVVNSGTTVYSDSAAASSRLAIAWQGMQRPTMILMAIAIQLVLLVLLVLIILMITKYTGQHTLTRTYILAWIILVACYLVYLSQLVFYNGDWPGRGRYDFPGVLTIPIFMITLGWLLVQTMHQLRVHPTIIRAVCPLMIIGLLLFVKPENVMQIRDRGQTNVANSQFFAAYLTRVAETLQENSDAALVLESHQIYDYETLYSWTEFLQTNGVKNPVFLRLHGYSSDSLASEREKNLALALEKTIRIGRRGISPAHDFFPFAEHCYSLQISGHTTTECKDIE